jgi:hypothetical protein
MWELGDGVDEVEWQGAAAGGIDWLTHNGADVALFLCGVLDGVGLQLGFPLRT